MVRTLELQTTIRNVANQILDKYKTNEVEFKHHYDNPVQTHDNMKSDCTAKIYVARVNEYVDLDERHTDDHFKCECIKEDLVDGKLSCDSKIVYVLIKLVLDESKVVKYNAFIDNSIKPLKINDGYSWCCTGGVGPRSITGNFNYATLARFLGDALLD